MRRFLTGAGLLALLCCCNARVEAPTGYSDPDLGWLFLDKGPYTLSCTVEVQPGPASLQLVTDLSLMADAPTVVFSAQTTVDSCGRISVPLGQLEPGFYQVRLRDSIRWNIGVRPEAVVSAPDAAPDFDAFWQETFAALSAVPAQPELTEVPAWSNEQRTCYELRFQSLDGGVGGGILSIPNAPGRYPAVVQYMGYGAPVFYFDPSAHPERIDFLVSVRDQGIFKGDQDRWIDRGLASRESFYYRGAFCDARRALDILFSLDKTDPDRVVAMGESQGGALTAVAAAWEDRLQAVSLAVPFLGDYPDYARIVWWPVHEVWEAADEAQLDRDALMQMLTYFDVKNFAPRIHCPVYMAFGLQDPVCPPHTNFSIYNNLGSRERHYYCAPTCGHEMWLVKAWEPVRDAFLAPYLQ